MNTGFAGNLLHRHFGGGKIALMKGDVYSMTETPSLKNFVNTVIRKKPQAHNPPRGLRGKVPSEKPRKGDTNSPTVLLEFQASSLRVSDPFPPEANSPVSPPSPHTGEPQGGKDSASLSGDRKGTRSPSEREGMRSERAARKKPETLA